MDIYISETTNSLFFFVPYIKMCSTTNIMNMPRATAIPIATLPVFKHLYIVKEKACANCYNELFRIYKTNNNWIIERNCDKEGKKFSVPVAKMSDEIVNILIMLGLERSYYKVQLYQNDEIIKSNKFKSICDVFHHIMKTEQLLIGVYYDNIN